MDASVRDLPEGIAILQEMVPELHEALRVRTQCMWTLVATHGVYTYSCGASWMLHMRACMQAVWQKAMQGGSSIAASTYL